MILGGWWSTPRSVPFALGGGGQPPECALGLGVVVNPPVGGWWSFPSECALRLAGWWSTPPGVCPWPWGVVVNPPGVCPSTCFFFFNRSFFIYVSWGSLCRLNQYDHAEEFLVTLKERGERTQEKSRSETTRSRTALDEAGSVASNSQHVP